MSVLLIVLLGSRIHLLLPVFYRLKYIRTEGISSEIRKKLLELGLTRSAQSEPNDINSCFFSLQSFIFSFLSSLPPFPSSLRDWMA